MTRATPTRDPDENYAREVMQLFTIGLYQLNPDGTQKLDPTGAADSDLLEHGCDGIGQGLHRLQLEHSWGSERYGVV